MSAGKWSKETRMKRVKPLKPTKSPVSGVSVIKVSTIPAQDQSLVSQEAPKRPGNNQNVMEYLKTRPRYVPLTAKEKQRTFAAKYANYKYKAIGRGLEWSLSKAEFACLWGKSCWYCGSAVETIGIDRLDNSKGYFIQNVMPCCKTCNWMKQQMTHKQFYCHIRKIIDHAMDQLKELEDHPSDYADYFQRS